MECKCTYKLMYLIYKSSPENHFVLSAIFDNMSDVYRWNQESEIYLHAKLWISTPILPGVINRSFLFYLQNY